jgi:hypothetical protein
LQNLSSLDSNFINFFNDSESYIVQTNKTIFGGVYTIEIEGTTTTGSNVSSSEMTNFNLTVIDPCLSASLTGL